jgi:flagellar biogenesis protein FliO
LPGEVIEILGRTTLGPREQLHLLRIGAKLVVVAVTSNGVHTLTEITDEIQVERIRRLCQQGQANSVSETFRQIFAQISSEASEGSRTSSNRRFNSRGDSFSSAASLSSSV